MAATFSQDTYTIGGAVSGLATGNELILQNNGGDNLTVSDNGGFTFATALADGSGYEVTVLTQPTSPNQTCSVTSGSGTVAGANVTDVQVTCSTTTYTIGGAVSGLATGNELVLQNNGGDNLTVSDNGGFTFATALADGSGYEVTVLTQPEKQTCTVANGSGTVTGANVTDVLVTCSLNDINIDASPDPQHDGVNVSGDGIYPYGAQVTLIATAGTNYTFVYWTEGNRVVSCNPEYSFTATRDRDLQANFSPSQAGFQYTITGKSRSADRGTVTGAGEYNHGDIVTMTALPESNFAFANWIETWPGLQGSCIVSTDEQYSFTALRDRNLTANMRPKALPGVMMLLLDDDK